MRVFIFTILLISTSFFCFGQTTTDPSAKAEFHIGEVLLIARDIKLSATWYRKFLNIEIKKYEPRKQVIMQVGDFTLLIKQGKNVIVASQAKLPKGKKYINGINKIGFSCNQFQSLYDALLEDDLEIVEKITLDKNLGLRYFITLDPDGNLVQIFEAPASGDVMTCQAKQFSITSSDYINTMRWYKEKFEFSEIEVKDNSKIHFQNILEKEGVIFEILHLPYESVETTEFMPQGRDLTGFQRIVFKSEKGLNTSFTLDNNANLIEWRK